MDGGGLTNEYLDNLCSTILKKFDGVYSCDTFSKNVRKIKEGQKFICNLSHSLHPGSHFIAIVKKRGQLIYFDSFGLECYDKNIIQVLIRSCTVYTYSKTTIQDYMKSDFCGFYCAAFLCFIESEKSLASFLSHFDSRNLLENDLKSVQLIEQFITVKHVRWSVITPSPYLTIFQKKYDNKQTYLPLEKTSKEKLWIYALQKVNGA